MSESMQQNQQCTFFAFRGFFSFVKTFVHYNAAPLQTFQVEIRVCGSFILFSWSGVFMLGLSSMFYLLLKLTSLRLSYSPAGRLNHCLFPPPSFTVIALSRPSRCPFCTHFGTNWVEHCCLIQSITETNNADACLHTLCCTFLFILLENHKRVQT